MKKSFCTLLLSTATLLSTNIKAQTPVNYVFTQDSLSGYDEESAKNIALSKHLVGKEYKFYMYTSKREFIDHKYHLGHTSNFIWQTVQTATIQPGCTNVDFESGTLAGWTVTHGGNSNSLTMGGCCPTGGVGVASVMNGTGTDPISGISLVSPLGGTKILKLNDNTAGNKAQRVAQSFNVTSSNAIFQIAYCGVLNSGGHDCFEQPYMNIAVLDSANNVLSCPKIDIQAPSAICVANPSVTLGWTPTPADPDVYYHTWDVKTIDLSPYIGSNVTIQITVADCIYSAHYGYGYFDCRCNPLEVTLNNGGGTSIFDATSQTPIDISTCGALNATISAPTGLGPYNWDGPPGSGVTGVSTQTVLANAAGVYTLTMNPAGNCYGPIVKYMILHVSPSPTASAVAAQPTCANATGSGQISVNGGTGPYTYSWTPAASNNDIANGLVPGTNYTIMVTDSFGCKSTTTLSINAFPDAPTFTITPLNGVLTCNTTSLTLSAITGTNTTAVWSNTTTPSFTVTAAGTYTCVLTNTVSVGQCSTSITVDVTSNTTPPVATYTVSCNTATIGLNASSSGGVALGWLAPTPGTATPVSNPGTSTAIGIYTLTATNLSTGCKTTYPVSTDIPNISLATLPANNIITCITPTVQATTTSTTSGVAFTWLNGVSSSTVNPFPITSPGTYTTVVSSPGGCTTQSVVTITSNTLANVNVSSTSTVIPCSTNSLALVAGSNTGGPYTYSWTPSNPAYVGNPYSVSNAGTYTVLALNSANGCTAIATYSVSKETISASFTASTNHGLMPLSVNFSNTSTNALNYSWSLGNSADTYTTTNAATIYDYQGSYTVTLIATNGYCKDTASTVVLIDLVSFLTIPNVFTPNGDGKNDKFTLSAINIGDISMTIFDRWGLKMYDTSASGNLMWDGKTKGGTDVADGTYFYIIKAQGLDGKDYSFQGTVNIFR